MCCKRACWLFFAAFEKLQSFVESNSNRALGVRNWDDISFSGDVDFEIENDDASRELLLALARQCTSLNPEDRPSAEDVLRRLESIKLKQALLAIACVLL
jgi:hypothetical protein